MSGNAFSKPRFLDENDSVYSLAEAEKFAIWIVTPPGYPHSQCFEDLAFAMQVAFRNLGFKAPVMKDLNFTAEKTIVLGPHLLPSLPLDLMPPGAVLFNLEQVSDDSPWLTSDYLTLARQNTFWDYSHINKRAWLEFGVNTDAICEVGYIEELTRIRPQPRRDIDVLFIGSLNRRRKRILDHLRSEGIAVHWLFNVYGEERDEIIARAKVLLNFHQHDAQIFEIVRVSYLLANHCCVVSETGADKSAERHFSEGIEFCSYEGLVGACLALLSNEKKQEALRQRGHEVITKFDQTKLLKRALLDSKLLDSLDA